MIHAWRHHEGRLVPLGSGADLGGALWIDLLRPEDHEVAALAALGVAVPTLGEMEEIEISNRFYREHGIDFLTVAVPGRQADGGQVLGPVTFILTPERLVTVRHHSPRAIETFAERADRTTFGCADHNRTYLGLVEEVVGRQADILEGVGREIDLVSEKVFSKGATLSSDNLQTALVALGQQGETIARVRFALLSLGRMVSTWAIWNEDAPMAAGLRPYVKALMRDVQSLEVHGDFLAGRLTLVTDTTLGLVNLAQNATVRIVSVVATLFLPPTLIASIYGMNFAVMPELHLPFGYPGALVLMAASAAGTWAYFRRRGWL
ncbi:MAG: magnesium transporter CorA family protein [Rubellimicrobium sp.]|nr:magnesium transporter CorA family protein [Rubellimicrobium sp.]